MKLTAVWDTHTIIDKSRLSHFSYIHIIGFLHRHECDICQWLCHRDLYVIILAVVNNILMMPVAYNNSKATKPQSPKANAIVMNAIVYSVTHSALSLSFVFTMDHDAWLDYYIDAEACIGKTRTFLR